MTITFYYSSITMDYSIIVTSEGKEWDGHRCVDFTSKENIKDNFVLKGPHLTDTFAEIISKKLDEGVYQYEFRFSHRDKIKNFLDEMKATNVRYYNYVKLSYIPKQGEELKGVLKVKLR